MAGYDVVHAGLYQFVHKLAATSHTMRRRFFTFTQTCMSSAGFSWGTERQFA
jgi:hypothetical protein